MTNATKQTLNTGDRNMTNWNDLDLENGYERSLYLLEPIIIDTLLLEIECNLKIINENTIRAQYEESLQQKINESREIFESNLKNFVKKSEKIRNTH